MSFSRRQQTGSLPYFQAVGSFFMSSSELVLQALTVFPLTKQHIHRDLMTQKESKANIFTTTLKLRLYIRQGFLERSHMGFKFGLFSLLCP